MELGKFIVPEALANYKVYSMDGEEIRGIAEELSLSELSQEVAEVKGAGLLGSYDAVLVGNFGKIEQEIKWRTLHTSMGKMLNPMKQSGFVVRGALQCLNTETNLTEFAQVKYTVKGRAQALNPGTMTIGGLMNASIKISATAIKLELNDEVMLDLDKLNGRYIVDGVDIMKKVMDLC